MAEEPNKNQSTGGSGPSAIPAPPPQMTQWQARRQIGWMSTIDFICFWILAFDAAGTLIWCLFGWPSAVNLIGIGIGTLIFLLLWTILLLYRSMLFTIGVHADIQMMPVESARIAASHLMGNTPQHKERSNG